MKFLSRTLTLIFATALVSSWSQVAAFPVGSRFASSSSTSSLVLTTASRFSILSPTTPSTKMTTRMHLSSRSNNMEECTVEQQVELRTGVSMLVLTSLPKNAKWTKKPTLLFLHGSFHGAWCWSENFFPYFTELGYPVAALSWRGTGGTFAGEGVKKVKLGEHVEDLESLLDQLESIVGLPSASRPVVIAHSFGSLAVMKDLDLHPERAPLLSGVAILCGVPPSGNGKMTVRTLKRSLWDSWKITAGFAMKRCTSKADLCRDLFFGGPTYQRPDGSMEDHGISDEDVARYQGYFARDSEATIDLMDAAKILPSASAIDGVAPFRDKLPPALVMGATDDFVVDLPGNEETAKYFALDEPLMVEAPHDLMLGSKWKNAADALAAWLEGVQVAPKPQ